MNQLPVFERQTEEPLYPKVLWNRPVSRMGAGRLLVPGGYSADFSLVTAMYQLVIAAGAGECVTALPDSLVKLLGGLTGTTFLPSSPSGSLGRQGLARLIELSEEADSVLIGANLSAHSETTVLFERFLTESVRPTVSFGDGLISLQHRLDSLVSRPNSLLIVTMAEVFKLAAVLGVSIDIRPNGGLINKLEIIRDVAGAAKCDLAVYGSEIIVAAEGKLGVTPVNYLLGQIAAVYYAALAVFWTQNPPGRYAGLMTGAYVLAETGKALDISPESRPSIPEAAKAIARTLAAGDHF